MKILILTSSSPYIDAGRVGLNLFNGLNEKGHYTKMIVRQYGNYSHKDIISLDKWSDIIIKKIKNRLRKLFKIKRSSDFIDDKYGFHDYDLTIQYYKSKTILKYVDFKPDVILYLFPQWFLNAENLYELNKATGAPIFWYLMDPSAITGGCHYFWQCRNYLSGCGKCPALHSDSINDQSSINFKFKQNFLNKTDIHVITGTQSDFVQTKQSLMFNNKPIHKVYLPVNHTVFKPTSKNQARTSLGLPNDKRILFFGSAYLSEQRKGMKLLTSALNKLKERHEYKNVLLLIAGREFEFIEEDLNLDYRYLGNLQNSKELTAAFQASDFFICPSIQDAGPFMINQSIMSGTPVISHEIGVALDLVMPNETGFLSKIGDIDALAANIHEALTLSTVSIDQMSKNCRDYGLKNLHINVFVDRIEKVFKTANS